MSDSEIETKKLEIEVEDGDKKKEMNLMDGKNKKGSKENNKKISSLIKSSPKKEAEEQENDGDEDSDDAEEHASEEDGGTKLGLFDQPLEISGSRERKKVQRLELAFAIPSKEKPEIPEGKGQKLGDCPRIEFQLQKQKADDLKLLHKFLFNRPGSVSEIKKNIRKFNGFPFTKDSPEFERKKAKLEKPTIAMLKHMCETLDIERSGTKEELIERLMTFLMKPAATGKATPRPKRRSSSKGKGRSNKGEKRKRKTTRRGSKSTKTKKKSGDSEAETSEEEEEEEHESENESEEESEQEEKKKPEKKLNAENKPKAKKKEETSDEEKIKSSVKKPVKNKKLADASSEDESSDDEPLVKKAKKPPTEAEIKQMIKKILDGANLEEITMKKVIKQVSDEYPEFDLSEKKDFIKSTVRSLIS
ncbi:protein DEK-like [Limulus polyphemus]|uniref:Protein DEK-like n=1 Tax=Limulus polyphemus TaxID=6850 RepID=A0ABM1BTC5_LIMPO|nr:protein DEK-like [Limulus polyphemus]